MVSYDNNTLYTHMFNNAFNLLIYTNESKRVKNSKTLWSQGFWRCVCTRNIFSILSVCLTKLFKYVVKCGSEKVSLWSMTHPMRRT